MDMDSILSFGLTQNTIHTKQSKIKRECQICNEKHAAKGLCIKHYSTLKRRKLGIKPIKRWDRKCQMCERHSTRSLCGRHYGMIKRKKNRYKNRKLLEDNSKAPTKEQLKDYQCNIINEKIRNQEALSEEEKMNCYNLVDKILQKEDNIGKLGLPSSIAGAVIYLTTDKTQREINHMVGKWEVTIQTSIKKIKGVLGEDENRW